MSTGTLSRKQNKREMQICTFIHCKVTSYYRIWASCGVIFCCNCIVTAFVAASGQILPALGLEQTWIEKCRCSPTYHVHVMPVKLILLGDMGTQQFGKLVFLMPSSGSYRCRFPCSEILSGPRGLWSRAARVWRDGEKQCQAGHLTEGMKGVSGSFEFPEVTAHL